MGINLSGNRRFGVFAPGNASTVEVDTSLPMPTSNLRSFEDQQLGGFGLEERSFPPRYMPIDRSGENIEHPLPILENAVLSTQPVNSGSAPSAMSPSSSLDEALSPGEKIEFTVVRFYDDSRVETTDFVTIEVNQLRQLRVSIASNLDTETVLDFSVPYSDIDKGWIVDLPDDVKTQVSSLIPGNSSRFVIGISMYSGYLTSIILRAKSESGRIDSSLSSFRRMSSPFRGAQLISKVSDDRGCEICHDMECSSVPDRVTVRFLWSKMDVDFNECCIKHDIALWCGPKNGDGSVDWGYAWTTSGILGACILKKFVEAGSKWSFWCGGPAVGIALMGSLGVVFAVLYHLVTFPIHLIDEKFTHWSGDRDHCCICGGSEPSKCNPNCYTDRAKHFCENPKTGQPKYLCNAPGCTACRNICFYEVLESGWAAAHRSVILKEDPDLPICPECESHCKRCEPGHEFLEPATVRSLQEIPGDHWVEPTSGAPYGQLVLTSTKCPE